jgi:hypothetical protein
VPNVLSFGHITFTLDNISEFTKESGINKLHSHQFEILCLLCSSVLGSQLVGYQAPANILFKIILPFRTTSWMMNFQFRFKVTI